MKLIYITALLTSLTITAVIMYPQYAEMRNIQQFCKLISLSDRQGNSQDNNKDTEFWNKLFAEKNQKKQEEQYLRCVIRVTRRGL
jgi:hypothetical protein